MLQKAGYILFYWAGTYIVILIISAVIILFLWALGIDVHAVRMGEIISVPKGSDSFTLTFLFSTLILAPILEEMAFRYPLKNFQNNYLMAIGAIILLIITAWFNKKFVGLLLLFLGLVYTIVWLLIQRDRIYAETSSKVIFAVSMVFFVLAHFGSMEAFQLMYWPMYMLYGVHLSVCAYFLAKIRMRKNTWYSIFLHGLYNLVPAFFLML